MLDSIFEAINKIIEFLDTIWSFVTDFFKDTLHLIELVGDTVTKIPDYFSWLPSSVSVLLVSLFTVVVLYMILGRQ